jgi:hypothetical protein
MAGRLGMEESSLQPVSELTGELDPRFVLWRKFCADHGIAIESLPGDLNTEVKEQWNKLKASELGATIK